MHGLTHSVSFILVTRKKKKHKTSEKVAVISYHTEIGGFEDGGFKVGLEPAERELGATGSHWAEERSNGWRANGKVE